MIQHGSGSNPATTPMRRPYAVSVNHVGPVTLHQGDATWHDGPGWYYTIDDRPDEGSCGAFPLRILAEQHARTCGHTVNGAVAGGEV